MFKGATMGNYECYEGVVWGVPYHESCCLLFIHESFHQVLGHWVNAIVLEPYTQNSSGTKCSIGFGGYCYYFLPHSNQLYQQNLKYVTVFRETKCP